MTISNIFCDNIQRRVEQACIDIESASSIELKGKVTRVVGNTVEAVGCSLEIGAKCLVINKYHQKSEMEVIGFSNGSIFLMPTGHTHGIEPGSHVIAIQGSNEVAVSEALLGRVIDGSGNAIDNLGELHCDVKLPLIGGAVNPLDRMPIREPIDVGIRSINALLSMGKGQRVGLFAGSGVGKSVLLGMMTKFTSADVVVVGLIGERGREVKEFIEDILGEDGLLRAVVVVSPASDPPLKRIHAAQLTTTIAEYFASLGKDVLLLMDSLTRFAQAQREIGLSVGEPPTTKGYTPSVFSKIPQLVERVGNSVGMAGAITAIYTVLVEGDDQNDPIADAARSILDGHIVLSRKIAESGIYPAIDIEASVSRVMQNVVAPSHQMLALTIKKIYALYQDNKDLITIGAIKPGANPELDYAIELMPRIRAFLSQNIHESSSWKQSLGDAQHLLQPCLQDHQNQES